jgi:hypothetical protein
MKRIVAVLTVFLLALPCFGWNATGHKAIGIIAYQHLTPATRGRVVVCLLSIPTIPLGPPEFPQQIVEL